VFFSFFLVLFGWGQILFGFQKHQTKTTNKKTVNKVFTEQNIIEAQRKLLQGDIIFFLSFFLAWGVGAGRGVAVLGGGVGGGIGGLVVVGKKKKKGGGGL